MRIRLEVVLELNRSCCEGLIAGTEKKYNFLYGKDAEEEVANACFPSVKAFNPQDPEVLGVFTVLPLLREMLSLEICAALSTSLWPWSTLRAQGRSWRSSEGAAGIWAVLDQCCWLWSCDSLV